MTKARLCHCNAQRPRLSCPGSRSRSSWACSRRATVHSWSMRAMTCRFGLIAGLALVVGFSDGDGSVATADQTHALYRVTATRTPCTSELVVRFRPHTSPPAQRDAGCHRERSRRTRTAPGHGPRGCSGTGQYLSCMGRGATLSDPRVLFAEPNAVYSLSALPDDPLFSEL